jgi:hypothetical protein
MASWDTTVDDIEQFTELLEVILAEHR